MSSGNVYKGFIYYVVCLINAKIYFGQTSRSPEIRWKRHVQRAFNENESYHSALHKAICKYGADNFKVYPFIEICAGSLKELKAKLNWIEIYLIAKYKTQITGYNLAAGGEGVFGNKWSENSRIKLSKTITGRKLTAEHRRKISRANKGKPSWVAGKHLSEEHKRKLSEARKGSGNPMFGRKHSSKSIKKMSVAHRKQWAKIKINK